MLIYIILFVCILVTLVVSVMALMGIQQSRRVSITDRIKAAMETGVPGGGGLRDEEKMRKSLVERILFPLSETISRRFSNFMPAGMVRAGDQFLMEAGLDAKLTGAQLTAICWMLFVGLPIFFFVIFFPYVAQHRMELWHVVGVCGISAILGLRLPMGMVQSRAAKRKHIIQRSLPFTFDLISVSVEAGMAFDGAISMVAKRTTGPLADELNRTLREINLGIARYDALTNLGKRTGVDDLKTFLTAVNYIGRLGGSLVDVIRIQTQALRVKRRQRAEKAAAQAPVKIMIPLVLFILPCVFMIILGPPMLLAFKMLQK